ncbi:hypothetical protein B4110_1841 [Parageobacillus toebii]|uniref:Uncharacterized protein n=1 Tax=Parageobacillus toebii TaxID=153151 RepID=A0A150N8X1_9BACL|nr:hypothetical protein B4110_1841 [Parageobacillus toebii]
MIKKAIGKHSYFYFLVFLHTKEIFCEVEKQKPKVFLYF